MTKCLFSILYCFDILCVKSRWLFLWVTVIHPASPQGDSWQAIQWVLLHIKQDWLSPRFLFKDIRKIISPQFFIQTDPVSSSRILTGLWMSSHSEVLDSTNLPSMKSLVVGLKCRNVRLNFFNSQIYVHPVCHYYPSLINAEKYACTLSASVFNYIKSPFKSSSCGCSALSFPEFISVTGNDT